MNQQLADKLEGNAPPRLSSIGKYRLIARLGQGGMATVYLGLVEGPGGFNKLMVLKVLRDDMLEGSEEAVSMFWNEARLSAQLVHTNIVHTFDVGEQDGRYFLAMEYLDGQTYRVLQTRALSRGGIALPEHLRILAEAARGLHYAHELRNFKGEALGVVHRDVSPQNIVLTYDGRVKVLDFGIAKMADSECLTQVGVIKGKLEYVAPEQLRGEPLDGRADVFALGAMLWEAVTGERFAGGRTVADVAKVHVRLSGGERKVRELKPETPEALASLVDRAIAVDPDARFEDASAFADALDAYLASIGANPNARTLASFIAPLFEQERARMRHVIDEQLQLVKREAAQAIGHTRDLPRVGLLDLTSSSTLSVAADGSSSGRRDLRREVEAQATRSSHVSARRRLFPIAAASLLTMAAGAGLVLYSSGREASQQTRAAGAATREPHAATLPVVATNQVPTAPAKSQPIEQEPAGRSSVLDVKVTPAHAKVTLDGAPIVAPFHGSFQKSASLHHLEVAAEGYRTYQNLISLAEDQAFDIALEASPAAPVTHKAGRGPEKSDRRAEAQEKRTQLTPPASAMEPGSKMPIPGSGIARRMLIVDDPYAE